MTSLVSGLATAPLQGASLRPAPASRSLARREPIFFEHEGQLSTNHVNMHVR